MASDQDFLQQLIATFKIELDERLESLNHSLLDLESGKGNRQELIDQIFREAHSLKGAARAVEIKEIEEVAHAMEALLSDVKNGRSITKPIISVLFKSIDFFGAAINARLAGGALSESEVHEYVDRIEEVKAGGEGPDISSAASPQGPDARPPAETEDPVKRAPAKPSKKATAKLAAAQAQLDSALPPSKSAPPPKTLPKAPPHPSQAESSSPALDADVESPHRSNRRAGPEDRRKRDRRLDDALLVKETIRVDTSKLDSLLAQSGELLITRIKISQLHDDMVVISAASQQLEKVMAELRKLLKGGGNGASERQFEQGQQKVRGLTRTVKRFMKEFSTDTGRLHTLARELQEEIKKIRMLPVGLVFDSFFRMLRDICEVKKKQIAMTTEGGDCALDKKLIEALKDPLMHLIRNSVDHGIEAPEVRSKNGKGPQGHIHLSARQKGDTIIITVQDDGGGIDVDAVRQKAVKRGFITQEEAEVLSEREIIANIFKPGFSTSPIIDDISGRGIGLDVVRTTVEKLNGTIDVLTEPGKSATFVMQLPLTVSTFQGLLVRLGGQVFILPIASVEQIRRISRDDIRRLGTSETVQQDGFPIQLARMANLLSLREAEKDASEKQVCVVLGAAEKRVAFLVDELLGEQEVILKTLGRPLVKVRYIAGATILGNGDIVMILNVAELINPSIQPQTYAAHATPTKKAAERRARTILVVDDSITTRMLEKNILESAGYRVLLATDGVEALAVLQSEKADLVLTDVEMPHMDGFTLTKKLKANPQQKNIPVILVTSLASAEDKNRGIEAGANAYIMKASFDQGKLLQTIEQLTD